MTLFPGFQVWQLPTQPELAIGQHVVVSMSPIYIFHEDEYTW